MTERTVEPQDIAPDQEVVDLFAEDNNQEEDLSQYNLEGALTLNDKGEMVPLVLEKEEEKEEVVESKEPEYEMPEKYRDKGLQDIIDMHRNAEKRMGQLQNELNEYKKLSEGIVKRELNPQPQTETAQSESIDMDSLLDNPEAAIGQLIENNPALKHLQEQLETQQMAAKQAQFLEKYPNALETAQSEHFQEWVIASPVRQRLYAQADQNYDLELAGELMDMYHGLHATAKAAAKAKQDDAYKTVAGVSSTSGKPISDGKQTRKKWYKQSQVLKIMEDPTAYQNALANGLEEAMAEGRIHYHL